MTTIRFYAHPLATPEIIESPNLALWLLETFGETPQGKIGVYENGRLLDTPGAILGASGLVDVVQEPGIEPISWTAVWTSLKLVAVSIAASYVIGALMAPGDRGAQKDTNPTKSPNNQLGQRDNQVRVLERVEDIYGKVHSIPSLMAPTYNKYLNNRQVEFGYYCIGRGYYDVTEIREGETLLSDFSRASAAVYAPFTSPGHGAPQLTIGDPISEPVYTVARSAQVDGATLAPLNQLQILGINQYELEAPNIIRQKEGRPGFSTISEPGQIIDFSAPAFEIDGTFFIARDETNLFLLTSGLFLTMLPGETFILHRDEFPDESFTIISKPVVGQAIVDPMPPPTGTYGTTRFHDPITFSAEIQTVGETFVTVDVAIETLDDVPATVTVQNGTLDAWTAWFTSSSRTASRAWMNVVAQGGLYSDSGTGSTALTVAYQFEVQQLDRETLAPVGPVYAVNSSMTGSARLERAETVEFVMPWVGPFRARAQRTTPHDYERAGVTVEEVKWTDLYAVSDVDRTDFGNKTTIQTVTYATVRATSGRQRQLNCKAFRKIPTFNGTTWSGTFDAEGRLATGSIFASARACDIIGALVTDRRIGNRPITDVDMAQVWATQMAIEAWNPICGEFNYTLDDNSQSLEDSIGLVARAVFCTAYRQSGRVRLFFDRAQAQSTALFSHRNKRPESESITRSFRNDSEYDGLELSYFDRDSTQSETIRLPLGATPTNYKKVEMPGVTHFNQAWYHANRQWANIQNRRIVIETEVTGEGRLMVPGARIDIVDNTRFKTYDGTVLGVNGLTVALSQPVVLGASPTIVFKRRDGSIQSIPITTGPNASAVVLAYPPSENLVTQYTAEGGVETEFSVASNDRRAAQTYLVQEIARSDGEYVKITAVNYTDAYYTVDTQPVPNRESVINAY